MRFLSDTLLVGTELISDLWSACLFVFNVFYFCIHYRPCIALIWTVLGQVNELAPKLPNASECYFTLLNEKKTLITNNNPH